MKLPSAGRQRVSVARAGCEYAPSAWSHLGHEDPLSMVRKRGRDVFQPVEERAGCRSCAWRTACSGGCPLMQGTAIHDRYCKVYQTLFPELVRLEGLRLLGA